MRAVTIRSTAVLVNGVPTRDHELGPVLKNARELWHQFHPDARFAGVVILHIDKAIPASAVKKAVRAATVAGYPNLSFQVRRR